ncbi:YciI family protein [Chitinophaga rhizosphaerae]|uniref:hypothetical protein n=1 Tax=Chitinophaga rhizosphaerae TaxID=1864947 RepID=UPI000F80EB6D|nr:hypothetical protein [Chitinophaga rhizosphaerae]
MAKLIPVFLLGVFLTFVIASFSSRLKQNPQGTAALQPATADSLTQANIVQQYWMVFFRNGDHMQQDSAAAALIDEAHVLHIRNLTREGKMMLAGAFAEYEDMRGMYVLKAADSLDAAKMVMADSAVATGRLRFDIKPWWTARNCVFK